MHQYAGVADTEQEAISLLLCISASSERAALNARIPWWPAASLAPVSRPGEPGDASSSARSAQSIRARAVQQLSGRGD